MFILHSSGRPIFETFRRVTIKFAYYFYTSLYTYYSIRGFYDIISHLDNLYITRLAGVFQKSYFFMNIQNVHILLTFSSFL